ncbi:cell division protein FtsB [bacterium BMS3Bbin14]|nr:cell division protein FtsB [bacterium BMS3Abin13]GBE53303.1 cell division protein FtsB [bacterium BMS3Bbin14]
MVSRQQQGLTLQERRFLRRIVVLVIVFGMLWLIFAPGRGLLSYRRLQSRIGTLVRENKALVKHNAELRHDVDRLQHDGAYLEELARQKYGLLKKNEMVFEYKPAKKKKK